MATHCLMMMNEAKFIAASLAKPTPLQMYHPSDTSTKTALFIALCQYVCLFSACSAVTSNCHYYKQHFQKLLYILIVEPIYRIFVVLRDQQRCAEAGRDPHNIWDRQKDKWFHIPERFPLRGRISRKTVFLRYFRVPCLCSAYGSREMFCDAYTLSIP